MYIQISIHDYLRALMGFHNFDTNFTLGKCFQATQAYGRCDTKLIHLQTLEST